MAKEQLDAPDASDLLARRLTQIEGICAVVSRVDCKSDALPDAAIGNAMWAVRELIEDAERANNALFDHWRALSMEAKNGAATAAGPTALQ